MANARTRRPRTAPAAAPALTIIERLAAELGRRLALDLHGGMIAGGGNAQGHVLVGGHVIATVTDAQHRGGDASDLDMYGIDLTRNDGVALHGSLRTVPRSLSAWLCR